MSEIEATNIACKFLAERESFDSHAYPDPYHGWGVPTIGYGTTVYPDGTPVHKGDVIDEARAMECLRHFVDEKCLPHLRTIPTWYDMNANQQAALISFTYNLGIWFQCEQRQSITRLATSPDKWTDNKYVKSTFEKYRNPGTNVENGLRMRRLLEADLFLTPGH